MTSPHPTRLCRATFPQGKANDALATADQAEKLKNAQ